MRSSDFPGTGKTQGDGTTRTCMNDLKPEFSYRMAEHEPTRHGQSNDRL